MKKLITLLFIISFQYIFAQVAIGTKLPHSSSILDIESSNKGLLIPRISLKSTSDTETVTSPALSLLVYNSNTTSDVTPGFYYWDTTWKPLKGSSTTTVSGGWGLEGNTLATDNEFIGTKNYKSLVFKVNDVQFGKFHPLGGMSIGNLSAANNNNSIAIGNSATATLSNEAIALGAFTKASGYRSTAIGKSSSASSNNSLAIGVNSIASEQNTIALGINATSSGQNATAIGSGATATQANSIILGNATNTDNKIGIGTSTPDERLHIAGSVKIVDGTQGAGKILTSDANGKARWVAPTTIKSYGDIYYKLTGQTVSSFNSVTFGSTNTSSNVTINNNNIQIITAGKYRITYRITLTKSTADALTVSYNLYSDFSSILPGSLALGTVEPNKPVTISGSIIANLTANQQIQVRSNVTDANVSLVANGCSLAIELID